MVGAQARAGALPRSRGGPKDDASWRCARPLQGSTTSDRARDDLVAHRSDPAYHAGVLPRHWSRHDRALHLFPTVHADRSADVAVTYFDQRLRSTSGSDRLAAPPDGRGGRSVIRPIDVNRIDGIGWQPAGVVALVAAAPGNPVKLRT